MVRGFALMVGFTALGCGGESDGGPLAAGGTAGNAPYVDSGADAVPVEADAASVEDASASRDAGLTVNFLIDEIFGGPTMDAGEGARFDEQGTTGWPVRYGFDTGLDGWEVVPAGADQIQAIEFLAHNEADAEDMPTSGSLELRTWFTPPSDLRRPVARVRAFSIDSGPGRDWHDYRVAASLKVAPGYSVCHTVAVLYVLAGAERTLLFSSAVRPVSFEWRTPILDLEQNRTTADKTQIFEFGMIIMLGGACPPP